MMNDDGMEKAGVHWVIVLQQLMAINPWVGATLGFSVITNAGQSGCPLTAGGDRDYGATVHIGRKMELGYDCVTIFAGTNDFRLDKPIGRKEDRDIHTFYGAYIELVEDILTKNPACRLNLLKESEHMAFVEHLKNCTECKKEYQELSQAWHALPFDYTEIEVPESLKGEVLEFVFDHKRKSGTETFMTKMSKLAMILKSQFTPVSTSLVAVLLLAMIGLGIANVQEKSRYAENIPIEILTDIPLKAANQSHPGTYGIAYIVQQGSEKNLVVQVHELPGVEGSQVYQVWLLKNGTRENGGIFKPDENGSGILTYQLAEGQTFDQIGITVEPDANSSQPRGEKIVGS
ncbi:hypothetical protein J14TS5_44910 [Paenibacillus lautus]|uniref:anti-sigma factor domain-containing protein n=1 Tax=Paenibacillus lautus TaxID=1401 RepID=UPI001B118523|nr:anti-sigma factor [Paenibacillus lautus]GIO99405.1 hypothetical protein J14TS5_44910 [Paenibacillus lautus]